MGATEISDFINNFFFIFFTLVYDLQFPPWPQNYDRQIAKKLR